MAAVNIEFIYCRKKRKEKHTTSSGTVESISVVGVGKQVILRLNQFDLHEIFNWN